MIDHIDADNRLVYLDSSTVDVTVQPIDIYRDMRTMRRENEELRKYDVFMTMKGAEKKNPEGTRRTERYLVLLKGTMIVPYDTSHTLKIDGVVISDDGLEGAQCFNRANLSSGVDVDINYEPKQVEVITKTIEGSALTPEEHDALSSISDDVSSMYEKLLEVRADILDAKAAGTYQAYD